MITDEECTSYAFLSFVMKNVQQCTVGKIRRKLIGPQEMMTFSKVMNPSKS